MIDYELTREQKDLQGRMTAFCSAEIAPAAAELDAAATDKVPELLRAQFKKLGGAGYFDLLLNADFVSQCVAGEEVAKAGPGAFLAAMSSGTAFGMALSCSGPRPRSRVTCRHRLRDKIGALAGTEAEAGSDLSGLSTKAERKGDQWILTGSKDLVTNAPVADVFLVLAWTDREAGLEKGLSLFVWRRARRPGCGSDGGDDGSPGSPHGGHHPDRVCGSADALVGEAGGGTPFSAGSRSGSRFPCRPCRWVSGLPVWRSPPVREGQEGLREAIGLFEGVGRSWPHVHPERPGRMMTLRAAWSTDHQRRKRRS